MLAEDKNPHSGSQVRAEYLVRGSMRLIVLPDVFMRLNHLVDDPQASVSEPVFDLMRIDQHLLQEIHEEILLQCAIVSDVMQAA